jgi:S1-C subfamily serine protease
VPANTVREVVPRLKKGDRIARPWLGVETSDSTNPAVSSGAEVQSVTPGGPADSAGLEPGDVIVEIDGQQVNDSSDISRLVNGKQPGDHVDLRIDRNGQDVRLGTTLGNRPQRTP